MITPGIWKKNGSAVTTNVPTERHGYTWEDLESEYSFYGGYLVAESMVNGDADLVSAAPEMLYLITIITEAQQDLLSEGKTPSLPYEIYVMLKKVLYKAQPDYDFPSIYYASHELYNPVPVMITGGNPDRQHHSFYSKEI